MRSTSLVAVCMVLVAVATGCQKQLNTTYGPSRGYSANRSINGFSALRGAFVQDGFQDRDVHRLTHRVRRAYVIVWTPTQPYGVEQRTSRWLEQWLRQGSRTLVYVLPDSGSESAYYSEAERFTSASQRLEYRRKSAESLVVEHQWQNNRSVLPSNGWFAAKPKIQRSRLRPTSDAEAPWDAFTTGDGEEATDFRTEWVIERFDPENKEQVGSYAWQQTGPGQMSWEAGTTVVGKLEMEFTSLVQTESGETVIAKMTHERWNGSQIVVVAGGSLLTNYALAHRGNQRLARQLIDATRRPLLESEMVDEESFRLDDGEAPLAGFAMAPWSMPISERVGEIPRASGWELLTVYPMGLVTMHAAILGIVICLMLLPVFGRPRPEDRSGLTHFGDHIDAVATLMRRRGGEAYARKKISDYMKRVRGETAGPWIEPDEKPKPTIAKLPPGAKNDRPTSEIENNS